MRPDFRAALAVAALIGGTWARGPHDAASTPPSDAHGYAQGRNSGETPLAPLCSADSDFVPNFGARRHVLARGPHSGQPAGGTATARHIASVMATGDRLSEQPPLPIVPSSYLTRTTASGVTVTVDDTRPLQTVVGFGGAFTQSAATVFSDAPKAIQNCLLDADAYFGGGGHGYTIGRIPIGTSDFAPYHYTHAETPDDTALDRFSIAHDRSTLIPLIQAAQNTLVADRGNSGGLKLVATPWTAPAWMKTNQNYRCPLGPICARCTVKDELLPVYAEYLMRFLDAYADIATVWALTVQNEPLNCADNYEAMHFTAETERDFIRDHLGPRMRVQHPETLLLGYDHNKDKLKEWADAILGDAAAANYTDGMAFHWYSGDQFNNVAAVRQRYPNATLVATEACEGGDGNFSTAPSWAMGEHYSRDIIEDINAGAVAWIDWNLWLDVGSILDGFHFGPSHYNPIPDTGGNNAMLVVDGVKSVVWPQAFYWHMGQISRFVLPNARVYATSTAGAGGLHTLAAQNADGSVAVVIQNAADEAVATRVVLSRRAVAVNFTAPPRSIHTIIFPQTPTERSD